MDINVEKGVPQPLSWADRGQKLLDAIKHMEVGDSFLWPKATEQQKRLDSGDIHARLDRARIKLEWKFSVRKTPDGLRVWRTA